MSNRNQYRGWGRGTNGGKINKTSNNTTGGNATSGASSSANGSNSNMRGISGRGRGSNKSNNHNNSSGQQSGHNRYHNHKPNGHFHDNKGPASTNILGYRRFTEFSTMPNDEVITAIDKNSRNFLQTIKKPDLSNDFLTLLVQIIGEKICGETSLHEIQNSLVAVVADPEFLRKLQSFTLTLMTPSNGSNERNRTGTNTNTASNFVLDSSPLRVLNAMCDLYAFIFSKMQNLALDHLPPNVMGALAILQMLGSRNMISMSADEFRNLQQRLTKLEEELEELKKTKESKQTNSEAENSKHHFRGKLTESDLERLYLIKPEVDFAKMSIIPTTEEVLAEEEPFLRPNLVKGKYPSALTYLDVQFRLLREDFVAPLRESVKEWVSNEPAYSGKKKKLPPGTIRFYHDVKLKKVECLQEITIYSMQFSTANLKRVKWEKSKRLLNGSLVLLTSDKFQTIYFATVYRRDERQLANGIVGIVWEGQRPETYSDVVYLMVECEVYFESYRHTLKALQFMSQRGPPHYDTPLLQKYRMSKYIINMSTEEVPPPLYLQRTKLLMDFSMVLKCNAENIELMSRLSVKDEKSVAEVVKNAWVNEGEDVEIPHRTSSSEIQKKLKLQRKALAAKIMPFSANALIDFEWPTARDLGMDEPQYSAFQSAITHELSIIQGPPGTGKTYIGLQIIKLFLSNPNIIWGSTEEPEQGPAVPPVPEHNIVPLEQELYEINPDDNQPAPPVPASLAPIAPKPKLLHSPILIVCYTNHALDQFLEGIISIMKSLGIETYGNLIRVGGRSKVETLAEYSIREQRDRYRKLRLFNSMYAESRSRAMGDLKNLQIIRAELKDVFKGLGYSGTKGSGSRTGILDFARLSKVVETINIHEIITTILPPELHQYFLGSGPRLLTWLGMNIDYFKHENFNSQLLLRDLFRIVQVKSSTHNDNGSQKENNGNTEVENGNEENIDIEGELELEDFGLKELMEANRLEEEIFMENDFREREKVQIPYFHLSSINFNNEFSKLEGQYKEAQKHRDDQTMRRIQYRFYEVQCVEAKWKNQLGFLQDVHKGVSEGSVELPPVTGVNGLLEQWARVRNGNIQSHSKFCERWAIYFCVIEHIQRALLREIMKVENLIISAQEKVAEVNNRGDGLILEKAMIVGLTTTGAAKYNTLLRMMKSRIVIVEEAAEVLESHIVTSITEHCEHLILIGDHQQLRPSTTVYKLAKDYGLDISLFERLIKNDLSWHYLKAQHRMRPEICKLLVPSIYNDLENFPNVLNYPDVPGFAKNLFFVTHHEYEKADNDSMTKSNEYEAKFLAKLCRYVMLQGFEASQITVLVTYIGQMFLVKKLINDEGGTCRGVRVTVVDNFQGEENDIILLSLVRSNEDNRVGFLKTDNRICVALSRAKHGMYVIGNMDCLLNSKSKTWAKISEEFHDQQSIGKELQLKCQIHKEIISIGSPDDFQLKAPEGGCTKPCPAVLPNCNHSCRLICHIADKEHKEYQCKLKCERHCPKPEKHLCPSPCFEFPCPPCTVLMMRNLPCNHVEYLACHIDHLTYKCTEPVLKELPCGHLKSLQCHFPVGDYVCKEKVPKKLDCGHTKVLPCPKPTSEWECVELIEKELACGHVQEMKCNQDPEDFICKTLTDKNLPCGHQQQVPCSKDVHSVNCITVLSKEMPGCNHKVDVYCHMADHHDSWICQSGCDTRLDCGHQCTRKCHTKSDPDHFDYKCEKDCARKCEWGHPCKKKHKCSEPCPDCQVRTDKTLPCGHILVNVTCHVDPNKWKCNQPCQKILDVNYCASGHQCVKKCYENCAPCMTIVEKTVIGCGHRMKVPCHMTAERSNCQELVPAPVKTLCGHSVEVPCRIQNTCTPQDCLLYCHQPCGHILPSEKGGCGHPCQGDCSSCFQGRIHIKCQEKCGRVLTCGHICKFPCSSLCPPCEEKCMLVCKHSKCKKTCGTPCTGCKERCKWSCDHKRCTRSCSDICNREACDEPCKKKLKCDHDCIGMCGEPCPPYCRTCDQEVVQEIFFGDEDEEDARFVFLEDCEHLIHKDSMDKWMNTEQSKGEIGVKSCPKCKKVISRSVRYGNVLKRRMQDVMTVRNKIFGNDANQKHFQIEAANQLQAKESSNFVFEFFRQHLEELTCSYGNVQSRKGFRIQRQLKNVDQYTFESINNMVSWWVEAEQNVNRKPVPRQQQPLRNLQGVVVPPTPVVKQDLTDECYSDLVTKYKNLISTLMKRQLPLSSREIDNFDHEFDRLYDLYRLYLRRSVQGFASFRGTELMYNGIKNILDEPKPYDDTRKDSMSTMLKQLEGLITTGWKLEERDRQGASLFTAMGFGFNHWYKCQNGHFYTVGNCGEFNQASRCPECRANIGGGSAPNRAGAQAQIVAELASTMNEPVPDFSYAESSRERQNNRNRNNNRRGRGRNRR